MPVVSDRHFFCSVTDVVGFTAIASNEEAPDTWTEKTYDLSAYDNQNVYIAIQHVSTNMFMFLIDDLEVVTEAGTTNPPTADFSSNTNTVCQGSTITFTNSATGADSYAWDFDGGASASTDANPSVVFNTPGTYTVELTVTNTDGSDTESKPNYIIVTAPGTLDATAVDVSCNGLEDGIIDLTVTGGTSPFTYLWSDGTTTQDLTAGAGSYSVTVTDNSGCIASSAAIIVEPTEILPSSTTVDNYCYGDNSGEIDLSVTGGTSPYNYSWSNGSTSEDISGLVASAYSVVITDSEGCTSIFSTTITEPSLLTVVTSTTDASSQSSCDGTATAAASGGEAPYTYIWSDNQTTQTATGLCEGNYTVTVTDINGCYEVQSVLLQNMH